MDKNTKMQGTIRILDILKREGVTQARIAEVLGIPKSAVSNLYAGTRQLKFDEGNILVSMLPSQMNVREVPLIGLAGAGNWVEAIEQADRFVPFPWGIEAKGRFAVEVVGDSMNLVLPEGAYAMVDPSDTSLFSGKIYLLLNADGEATIKRYRSEPSRFEPDSDNPEYVPFEVGALDFRVIGRVTFIMRPL